MAGEGARSGERPWSVLELEHDLDEEREQEIDDRRLPPALRELLARRKRATIDRQVYFSELLRLQSEPTRLPTRTRQGPHARTEIRALLRAPPPNPPPHRHLTGKAGWRLFFLSSNLVHYLFHVSSAPFLRPHAKVGPNQCADK